MAEKKQVNSFLKNFKKNIEKIENVSVGITSPKKWYSIGNYALNKILTGSYHKAFAEGRITGLVGVSGCLPKDEIVEVYEFKTLPFPLIEIQDEK